MKSLEINGVTLYYEKEWCGHPDVSELDTHFYTLEGKRPEKKWSWRKLRKVETGNMIDNFVKRFEIGRDIESSKYTKGQVRNWIAHRVELLGRAKELANGEII